MGEAPTPGETRAAAEIAARLGFETMALDLPLARGTAAEGVLVAIGRGGLAASGLASPGVDPTSLDADEGAVVVREADGRRWVLVLGGGDEGLVAAARMFAGALRTRVPCPRRCWRPRATTCRDARRGRGGGGGSSALAGPGARGLTA